MKFRATRALLNILARNIGIQIGFLVPEALEKYPSEMWSVLPIFRKMRALGIVDTITFVKNIHPDEPQGFMTRVSIQLEGRSKKLGFSGIGRDMFDQEVTLWPAIGEALERWAIDIYNPAPNEIKKTSYRDLAEHKMDIFKIVGFSDDLRKRGNKDYKLSFSEDTQFTWVKGYSLTEEKDIWLPLQLVSFTHGRGMKETGEPLLSPLMSTGAAAGQNLKSAITSGLLEVIERDAYMIYWLNKISPDLIDIRSIPDHRFIKMLRIAERYHLDVYLQYLKTDVPVHTVGILVIDRTGIGPSVSVGAVTSFSLLDAVYKVLSSTLAVRQSQRTMYMRRDQDQILDPATLGHEGRMLYYSLSENIQKVDFLTRGRVRSFKDIQDETSSNVSTLDHLIKFFKGKGYQVIYKQVLSSTLQEGLGDMTAVMVRVPELQPLHLEESLAAKSGARLHEVPEIIGRTPAKVLNTDPHPFP